MRFTFPIGSVVAEIARGTVKVCADEKEYSHGIFRPNRLPATRWRLAIGSNVRKINRKTSALLRNGNNNCPNYERKTVIRTEISTVNLFHYTYARVN